MDAAICIPIFLISICSIIMLVIQVKAEETAFSSAVQDAFNVSRIAATSGLETESDYYLFDGRRLLVYWPFLGEPKQDENERVFIFPKSGERYHVYGCSTLKEGECEVILTDEIRSKYISCKICKPNTLLNGSSVYVYSSVSYTYHKKSCATITKSYEAVSIKEAEEKGYTPCKICIGSE